MDIKDFLKLHFIILILGFTAILGKLISLSALETVVYRSGIASLGLGILLYFSPKKIIATKLTMVKMFFIGFIVAAHWITFFGAAKVSNVSTCLIGLSTMTFWTAIFEPIFNNKKFSFFDVLFGVFVIFGLYILSTGDQKTTQLTTQSFYLGLLMSIVAAALAALFSVLNFSLINHNKVHQDTISFFEMFGAFIGCFFLMPVYSFFFPNQTFEFILKEYDLLWILVLSLLCTVYAYSASVEIMKRVSAFMVNLSFNMEPIYGIILALIIFPESEKMNLNFYLGGIIILFSVVMYPIFKKKLTKKRLSIESLSVK